MQIGKTIRDLRKARDIRQKELAARTLLTPTYISLIERNKRKPTLKAIRNIAEAFGMGLSELILASINPQLLEETENNTYIQLIVEPIVEYFAREK